MNFYVLNYCTKCILGVLSDGGLARLMMYTLLAVVVSLLGPERGMFDCLLWTHACVGLMGYISPMGILSGVERLLRLSWSSERAEHVRASLLMFLVFISGLFAHAGLMYTGEARKSTLLSSLFVAIPIANRYLFNGADYRHPLSVVDDASHVVTKQVISCSFVTTEVVCIDRLPGGLEIGSMTEVVNDEYTAIPCKGSPISRVTTDDSGIFEPPRAATIERKDWYYLDLKGNVQGPFPTEMMKTWHLANLLPQDLLVANSPEPSAFAPLSQSSEYFAR